METSPHQTPQLPPGATEAGDTDAVPTSAVPSISGLANAGGDEVAMLPAAHGGDDQAKQHGHPRHQVAEHLQSISSLLKEPNWHASEGSTLGLENRQAVAVVVLLGSSSERQLIWIRRRVLSLTRLLGMVVM